METSYFILGRSRFQLHNYFDNNNIVLKALQVSLNNSNLEPEFAVNCFKSANSQRVGYFCMDWNQQPGLFNQQLCDMTTFLYNWLHI